LPLYFRSLTHKATQLNNNLFKKLNLNLLNQQNNLFKKKSPVKKAIKVKMIEVEKEKATTSPKQKAKLEDSNI
jgi:hypothetical protein